MADDAPTPEELEAEAEGETLGEAKWAAMKALEPRFPGISAETVAFEVLAEPEDERPARVRGAGGPRCLAGRGRAAPGRAGGAGPRHRGARGACARAARHGRHRRDRGRDPRDRQRRRPRPTDRQARHDDRRASAPRLPRRLPGLGRPEAGRGRRRRLPRAARDRPAPHGRPGRSGGARVWAPGGARADARHRAQDRAHVSERARGRRDPQRGGRARPAARRHPLARHPEVDPRETRRPRESVTACPRRR